MAEKETKVEFEGEVLESFRSGMYRIGLDNGHETLAYTSGRMRHSGQPDRCDSSPDSTTRS